LSKYGTPAKVHWAPPRPRAYRALAHGELAVVPNTSHIITPPLVELMVEFLERWS
jgi:hypothetical protein